MNTQKITRGERPKRTSVVDQGRLIVENKDPSKVYRVVNDEKGKVDRKLAMGWEIEKASDHPAFGGGRRVDVASSEGANARIPVGNNIYGVLMSQPKEWFEEDQKAKQEQVDATEQTIKNTALSGHKGSFQVSRNREPT